MTQIAVDDSLIQKARSLTTLTSNDDVISVALQEFIASSEDRKDALRKFGKIKSWDPQFAGWNPKDYAGQ
jgi:Arc/MetJ family transcription regulator